MLRSVYVLLTSRGISHRGGHLMPFASRVLLSAALALLPIASVPFPAVAAQRHTPVAAARASTPILTLPHNGPRSATAPANLSIPVARIAATTQPTSARARTAARISSTRHLRRRQK